MPNELQIEVAEIKVGRNMKNRLKKTKQKNQTDVSSEFETK